MTQEQGHLDIIKDILENGSLKEGRNGWTRSLFVRSMKWSLNSTMVEDGISFDMPYSTTAGTFLRGLLEEFRAFIIDGTTDSKLLEKKGINIWKPNTEKTNGIIGPAYGHNYKNYGGTYDPSGQTRDGLDQVSAVIESISTDPDSRRHVILNYDPRENSKCVLYPCQMMFQLYVNDGTIDIHSYNRSSDICCAGIWNTGFASLLLGYISLKTGLKPGNVIMTFGDVHIYENQVELAKSHVSRECRAKLPKCNMTMDPSGSVSISFEHVDKDNYYPGIKYPMTA